MESRQRSLVKSILWRSIGVFVLSSITWLLTNNLEVTTILTFLYHTMNLVLYYFHERFWDRIEWGLLKKTEQSLIEQEKTVERLRKLGYIE